MASDDDILDSLADVIPTLPEPVAAAVAAIELARADGDATGVRKRAFELGIALVRYGVSLGLALLDQALGEQRAPTPVRLVLGNAARLSDGQWCELLRTIAAQLGALGVGESALFGFASGKSVAELVRARNRFAHEGARGDEAPMCAKSVLDDARALLAVPLRVVAAEARYEERRGVPLRPGAWRKREGDVPGALPPGAAYVALADRSLPVARWLPVAAGRLLLIDAPAAAGKPWRSLDPESGERRDAPELDAAVRRLVGDDAAVPIAPSERPTLMGRGAIVSAMRRIADRAREGGVSVLVLTGPQGIGRGRLLEVMRDSAAQYGFGMVLEGACSPIRRSVLRPLRRALEGIEQLAEVKRALERALDGNAGSHGLEAAVEAIEETLVEASLREPVLWLLDDAQWADETTVSLLSLLAERASRMARGHMMVLVTVRDEPGASAALKRFIGEVERDVGPAATRLTLGALDETDARKVVRGTAPIERELEDALVAGAAGVPFYLVQSTLAWFETGALVWKEGRWLARREGLAAEAVPGMADVVSARLAACFPAEEELRHAEKMLFLIGVSGGGLRLGQLLAAAEHAGIGTTTGELVLEALVDAGIVQSRGARHEYDFAQPLLRRAVVDALRKRPWAPRAQRALYDEVATGDTDEDAAFLAGGYRALGAHDQAYRWLERAVRYALRMGLFRDAAERANELAEQVAALPHDPVRSIHARILRTSAAAMVGEELRDDALVADADAVSRELGLEARLALAKQRRGEPGLILAEEAVALLDDRDAPELRYRALVLRSELSCALRSLADPAVVAAIEATAEAARAVGSAWALLDAENDLALMTASLGNVDDAIAQLERVVSQAGAQHFGSMQRGALVNIAALSLREARFEAAEQASGRAAELAHAAGDARNTYMAQSVRSEALRKLAKLDEALAAANDAVAIAVRLGDVGAVALLRRSDIREALGDADGALADIDAAYARAVRAGNPSVLAQVRLRQAMLRGQRDESARAALLALIDEIAATPVANEAPVRQLLETARLTAR